MMVKLLTHDYTESERTNVKQVFFIDMNKGVFAISVGPCTVG